MAFGGGDHRQVLGGGLFGKESTTSYEVYLNLTPLMDVMSNILFFLLAAFGSSLIAILPTTVPIRSTEAGPPPEEDKVTVNVRADGSGLAVNCDSAAMTPESLRELNAMFKRVGGEPGKEYDYAAFASHLKRVKERYPASSTMVLAPSDELTYDVIVHIMDAARDYPLPDGKRMPLFAEVVLSSVVTSVERR